MASLAPSVVEIEHAPGFLQYLQYLLEKHAPPSTLIVCSSKSDFLQTLQAADTSDSAADEGDDEHGEQRTREVLKAERMNHFAPTLRLLSTSRTLKLAFCPDITHLRAYLACYTTDNSSGSAKAQETDGALRVPGAVPILAILNLIEVHRSTSAFSAQGINRTLSIAVEAAYRNGQRLVLAETAREAWTEELSLLNVTNKRLGDLAVGRTVTAKAVAERWCTFEKGVTADSRSLHRVQSGAATCPPHTLPIQKVRYTLPYTPQHPTYMTKNIVIHRPVLNLMWNITSSRSDIHLYSIIHRQPNILKNTSLTS